MAITKSKKTELVSNLKTKLEKSNFVVIVHYRGMDGQQLYNLRVSLRSKNCHMKIVKNTLVNIAIKDTQYESLSQFLKGPTAILHCEDPVALAKIVSDTAKEVKCFEVKAGFLDNSIIKEGEILNLAKLGSLEEVRASFIGKLTGIQSNFVGVLNAPQTGLVSLFKAKAKQS